MVEPDSEAKRVVEGEMFGAPVPGQWPGSGDGDADALGKYRWRTRLRVALPTSMRRFVPKGAKDCGDHDWYKSGEDEDRCYHCDVGVRRPSEL